MSALPKPSTSLISAWRARVRDLCARVRVLCTRVGDLGTGVRGWGRGVGVVDAVKATVPARSTGTVAFTRLDHSLQTRFLFTQLTSLFMICWDMTLAKSSWSENGLWLSSGKESTLYWPASWISLGTL